MIFKKNDDVYTTITNEILAASESVPDSIHNVLLKLAKKNPGAVYWICKKFLQEYQRFFIVDSGYIGISDRWLNGVMYPGDLLLFSIPEKMKTGDIIQIIFTDDKEEKAEITHGRISSFTADGKPHVKDVNSDKEYTIGKWNVLGKLVKVIPFDSKEWKEICPQLGSDNKWLKEALEEISNAIKKSELKERDKLIKELDYRLSKLK